MQMFFRIKTEGFAPGVPKRLINQVIKSVLHRLGVMWHEKFRGKHFTVAGAREYGYTPRKGEGQTGKSFWRSYTGRKKKETGHQRPLVFSGESQMLTRIRDVRATSKRVRVVMRAKKFNYRNEHSDIRMHDEMTRVSDSEHATMVRAADEMMAAELRSLQHHSVSLIASAA